jgi:hypothetical protein
MAYVSNEFTGDVKFIERQTTESLRGILADPHAMAVLGTGAWELVWGPCVYQVTGLSYIADHTMFVVRSAARPTQLVASICGTHPLSLFNWFRGDFDVH